ncbi:MAG: efflux RND transporter periplasmic adaptor subunit [Bacteroidia bacterium]
MNRIIFLIVYALLAGTLFSACKSSQNQPETDPASVEEETTQSSTRINITQAQFTAAGMTLGDVTTYDFPQTVQANGYIDVPPGNLARVSAFMEGYVDKINLLEGDRIQKGQLLLSLTNPAYIQLQQEYLEVREQRAYLRSEYERQKTLSSENIASQKNFLKAESEYKTLEAKFAGLAEKLKLINIDPEKVEPDNMTSRIPVYAPISGSISGIFVNKGQFVSPSDVVVEITNVDHIHVELQVFEKDILQIREDQEIIFRIPGAGTESYEAIVHRVGRAIHDEKRTVPVHGHLKHEKHNLVTGMFVEASIIVSKSPAAAVPAKAVIEEDGHYSIFTSVQTEGGGFVFTRKEIEPGKIREEWAEIKNPEIIAPGEKVLVNGAFSIMGMGEE